MTISLGLSLVPFLTAAVAAGLAGWLFANKQAAPSYLSLAVLAGAIAFTHCANGLGLVDDAHVLLWRRFALVAELFQPAALFYSGIQFLNQAKQRDLSFRHWVVRVMGGGGLLLAVLTMTDHVLDEVSVESGGTAIVLASWGHLPYVFVIIAMALGLAQLEVVLRASSEPIRYRLKLIVIGLGGLAGYQIYQASQMLLLPIWRSEQVLVFSVVTIISLALLLLGILRSRFKDLLVNTYVSQQALLGSMTFIVIGFYLLVVGIVGEWLRRMNRPLGAELSAIIVFGALVALAIAVFSKTVRAGMRRFLARNFYRSKYDYRAEWLRVTEAFQIATNKEAIIDHLLDFLIKTFSTTSIMIWLFRDADRRFFQARPAVIEKESLEVIHPVIRQLLEKDEPVMVKGGSSGPADVDPLIRVGAELCFPIRAQGQLVAFIVLGKQPSGEAYGTDDCDLLHGICHHVGALLSLANLAEERQAAAELEALHRFSGFCLHDLKNLAARLSLVAQNAECHGHDPAFQQAALRTVADTAKKMTSLMSKLSLKSFTPEQAGPSDRVDILQLIEEIVAPLKADSMVSVQVRGGAILPLMAVREQIHQLLLNVVLNARQAIRERGEISIAVDQLNGFVIIRVEDTGCGIPHQKLDALFRPSQSGRPGGLGIGLYQCKKIVEAHGGTIEIFSEGGKGTRVRIALPLHASENQVASHVIAQSGTASL